MAITIFTVPAMSAGPERVFSGARHTIAWERTRLSARMVEMMECLKSWVRIPLGKKHSLLSGVFRDSLAVEEAAKILEEVMEELQQAEESTEEASQSNRATARSAEA